MLFDTHAHLNFKAFSDDWPEVIKRAKERDIGIIIPSTDLATSRKACEIAEKYERGVYAAVGLHPIHVYKEPLVIEEYKKLAQHPKVVAIGEVGLDDFHVYPDHSETEGKALQRQVLKEFITLAQELCLPLILHCRPAKDAPKGQENTYDELVREIENLFACHSEPPAGGEESLKRTLRDSSAASLLQNDIGDVATLRGVVHCFLGTFAQAQKFFNLGFMVSFGGVIIYPWFATEVVRQCPLDKIMIDTDSPYLSPEPHRKTRNEPVNVEIIAQKIAEIKNIEYTEVEKATTNNALKLFSKIANP